jgi:SNF2 family DNA or RNA helicase
VPVTAWRIIAAQTIDAKIAELIDSKQGLASRALEGIELDGGSQDSVALDALIDILARALSQHELVAEMNETFTDEVA